MYKHSLSDHSGYFSSLCTAGDDLDSRRLDLFVHRIAINTAAETVGSIVTCCFRARISGHVKGRGNLPTVSSKHWRGSLAPSCLDWRTWTGPSAPEESQQMKVTECHTQLGLWLRRWWFLGRAILLGANARESGLKLGQEWTKSDLTWIFIWQLRIYDSSTNLHERYANCLHGLSFRVFLCSFHVHWRQRPHKNLNQY